ncbi:hypothetical protein ACFYZ9_37170 [Streptomyces sp. NPDC001691]|uniref:hypothetical protein n=1 Tax=unclassified Streptomyces TaxID=2593676 RepID=UPI000DE8E73E|nr:hypothetical protein [Streptomyces sp. SDr-06]RCH59685.1 hypothetical protein DT019_38330 [Streptomyces sp. SDr-06]
MVTKASDGLPEALGLLAVGIEELDDHVRRHLGRLLAAPFSVRTIQVLKDPVSLEMAGTGLVSVAVALEVEVTVVAPQKVGWIRGAFTMAIWRWPDGTQRQRTWFEPTQPLQHAALALSHRLHDPHRAPTGP